MTMPKPLTPESTEKIFETVRDEIAHWRHRTEVAEWQLSKTTNTNPPPTNTNPPPMVAPGVPYMDLVLASGRQLRFTANFGVFLTMIGFLLEEGVEWDSIDQLPAGELAAKLIKPERMESIIARAGMALQPDEMWNMVLAQLDMETCIRLVTWLIGAVITGQDELTTAAQEDAPGEAPDSGPTPSPG